MKILISIFTLLVIFGCTRLQSTFPIYQKTYARCNVLDSKETFNANESFYTYMVNSLENKKDSIFLTGEFLLGESWKNQRSNNNLITLFKDKYRFSIVYNDSLVEQVFLMNNGRKFNIPNSAFGGISSTDLKVKAYNYKNYIFLYLHGGMAAHQETRKLVFSKKSYITTLSVDYFTLSSFCGFQNNLIGL